MGPSKVNDHIWTIFGMPDINQKLSSVLCIPNQDINVINITFTFEVNMVSPIFDMGDLL